MIIHDVSLLVLLNNKSFHTKHSIITDQYEVELMVRRKSQQVLKRKQ